MYNFSAILRKGVRHGSEYKKKLSLMTSSLTELDSECIDFLEKIGGVDSRNSSVTLINDKGLYVMESEEPDDRAVSNYDKSKLLSLLRYVDSQDIYNKLNSATESSPEREKDPFIFFIRKEDLSGPIISMSKSIYKYGAMTRYIDGDMYFTLCFKCMVSESLHCGENSWKKIAKKCVDYVESVNTKDFSFLHQEQEKAEEIEDRLDEEFKMFVSVDDMKYETWLDRFMDKAYNFAMEYLPFILCLILSIVFLYFALNG